MVEPVVSWPNIIAVFMSPLGYTMEAILTKFGEEPEFSGRSGAYVCIADGETGFPLAVVLVGGVNPEKARKYIGFCQEKAFRLASRIEHASSFESRNPDAGEWGGAIRAGKIIFSMSGLTEQGDEAAMLLLAACVFPDSDFDPDKIALKNGNTLWPRFKELLPDVVKSAAEHDKDLIPSVL